MRRVLLPLALVAAAACATPAPSTQKTAAIPVEGGTSTVPGFERRASEIVAEYDLTHDGRVDVWKYTWRDAHGKEILLRKEKDLNGDGKIDTWERYEPDGSLSRVAYDLDFDGKADTVLHYEKDQLVRKEMAFGYDGVPRAWHYYEKAKLVRKERDTNGDGNVDYWEYWENAEIDRIGVDADGDGQVDRWEARKTAAAPAEGGAAPVPAAQK